MWTLAVDFGTSATAVAVSLPGQPARLVNFGTASAMPSAILAAEDGSLVIGLAAVNQRRRSPERFEAYPKRHMGEATWFLGRPVDPVEAVSAILRAAGVAGARQFDGRPPARVVLTHPAGWEATKLDQFTRAAAKAGLNNAVLVPEPLAAAAFYAAEAGRPPAGKAAVYDLGGGTFDAAVVEATRDTFEVRRSGGLDWVGGVAFDYTLLELVGTRIAQTNPDAWDALSAPFTPADLQARALLVDDVRTAKEALSDRQQTSIFVPMISGDVLITRGEFENAIRSDVDASVDLFLRTVTEAGLRTDELSAAYLVGGSSAIPLVSETLFRRLGRRPVTRNDPKAVVALGAASWPMPVQRPTPPRPTGGQPTAWSGSGGAGPRPTGGQPAAWGSTGAGWSPSGQAAPQTGGWGNSGQAPSPAGWGPSEQAPPPAGGWGNPAGGANGPFPTGGQPSGRGGGQPISGSHVLGGGPVDGTGFGGPGGTGGFGVGAGGSGGGAGGGGAGGGGAGGGGAGGGGGGAAGGGAGGGNAQSLPPMPLPSASMGTKKSAISPKLLIGSAAGAVLIIVVAILLISTLGGHSSTNVVVTSSPGVLPVSSTGSTTSSSPTSSSITTTSTATTSTTTATTTTATTPTTSAAVDSGWAQFAPFAAMVGTGPGDSTHAYLNATCALQDDTATLAKLAPGSSAAIVCSTTTVDYSIYLFPTAQDVTNTAGTLVSEGFVKTTWNNPSGAFAGDRFTVTNSGAEEIATSFLAEPTFLVDIQSNVAATTEQTWKSAPFPS